MLEERRYGNAGSSEGVPTIAPCWGTGTRTLAQVNGDGSRFGRRLAGCYPPLMAQVTNELMFEVLKSIQQQTQRMDLTLGEVKLELQAIRGHQLAMQQDISVIYSRLGSIEQRVDRIERRLGLTEPAH